MQDFDINYKSVLLSEIARPHTNEYVIMIGSGKKINNQS